jgi:hypothetical protein
MIILKNDLDNYSSLKTLEIQINNFLNAFVVINENIVALTDFF